MILNCFGGPSFSVTILVATPGSSDSPDCTSEPLSASTQYDTYGSAKIIQVAASDQCSQVCHDTKIALKVVEASIREENAKIDKNNKEVIKIHKKVKDLLDGIGALRIEIDNLKAEREHADPKKWLGIDAEIIANQTIILDYLSQVDSLTAI